MLSACVARISVGLAFVRTFGPNVPRGAPVATKVVSLEDCSALYDSSCCVAEKICPTVPEHVEGKYHILSLSQTFEFIAAGGSISRFGDGEMRGIKGGHIIFEKSSKELEKGLSFVAALGGRPQSSPCLCVGTYPVLDANFSRFREGRHREFAKRTHSSYTKNWNSVMRKGVYCDSFISRAENVNPAEFPALHFFTPLWQRIFKGRRVLLVRGSRGNNIPSTSDITVFDRHLQFARSVEQLISFKSVTGSEVLLSNTSRNIFADYRSLRDEVMMRLQGGAFDIVVISLGPTATILAAELSCRGYQAIDAGQFGGSREIDGSVPE